MHDTSKYKKLTDIEHVLLKPGMYLGTVDQILSDEIIFADSKANHIQVTYIPALIKMINEIIDNSVDEAIRTDYKFANRIKITMTNTYVAVADNGRGIPVEIMEGTNEYIPQVLFTETKSGSNFEDSERKGIGTNGFGSCLTNIFSTSFIVNTRDSKRAFHLDCKDNLSKINYKLSVSTGHGTDVTFIPDFKRFRITDFDKVYFDLIRTRLHFLAISYPSIVFYFNEEKITATTPKKFVEYFTEDYELIESDNYFIGVGISHTNEFEFLSYANGINIKKGGNHIQLISSEIVAGLREKLEKKYKSIKPNDIKSKLQLYVFFKDFPAMKFDSQTKEFLSNSVTEIKAYLGDIDFSKLYKAIIRNENMFFAIEEFYKVKEEFQHRQILQQATKSAKKIKIEKYLPSILEKKYLCLCEGDSAMGGLSSILGRKGFSYFPLRGKVLNVEDTAMSKIAANEELKNIIAILQLDLSNPETDMIYENVLIASDQDLDGFLIRGLALTFFHRFCPRLVREGRIKYLKTPLLYSLKKDIPDKWFFNTQDAIFTDNDSPMYSKGLGSWKKHHLQYIIEKETLEKCIETFILDANTKECITGWLGTSPDYRKDALRGIRFSHDKV